MTVTQIIPTPSLAGNLDRGQALLAIVRASLPAAGEGARAFTRIALQVETKEEVDAFAVAWGVTASWTFSGAMYLARWIDPTSAAEAEAVYYPRHESEVAA